MGYATPDELNQERRQWVVVEECGCACAVLEGSEAPNRFVALQMLYPTYEEREHWFHNLRRSLLDVTHSVYEEKYLRHMKLGYCCPHEEQPGFWRRFWDAFTGRW